jgi:phosphate transport system protein
MSRAKLDESLMEIRDDAVRMGSLAHTMVELAVRSVLTEDPTLVEEVTRLEGELDSGELLCSQKIVELAILQSPVADDLLFLTSTLVILGEIERTGDDAFKLARRYSKLTVPFPEDLKELLKEIDHQARTNLMCAVALISSYDSEGANRLVQSDSIVDESYKTSRRVILEKMVEEPEDRRQHFRISEIFHALEHVSDHAVNIAKTLRLFYDRQTRHAGL